MTALSTRWWVGGKKQQQQADKLLSSLDFGRHLNNDGLPTDREADGTEGVDEDMIVTQSQTNFICPITQLEMKKPVKNKVCGHTYEEEAIVRMIESKHKRRKKACFSIAQKFAGPDLELEFTTPDLGVD
ncbi:hypothetical protein CB1_000444012 [Camelus ferus]|nr:hypothetical protein CB1_000444012 [Camelus ferus]